MNPIISFKYATRPGQESSCRLEVQWNGSVLGTFDGSTLSGGWHTYTATLQGSAGATTRLLFSETSGDNNWAGMLLDEVTVYQYQPGNGNDTLDGGSGADSMAGGLGNDTYVVDNASDVVTENASEGTDTIQSAITYTLTAHVETLSLTGSSNINATGGSGSDTLLGNSGNNTLDGAAGADTMAGGVGNDTYIVNNTGDVVTENASEGADTIQASISYTLTANIETLLLTGSSNINATGGSGDDTLLGNTGVNTLTGNAGNDTLDGAAGADTMIGGVGNDTYVVNNTGDLVTENVSEGTDTVLSSITYTLSANVENLSLTGTDMIKGYGNALDNTMWANNSGWSSLLGGDGNDTLYTGNQDEDSGLLSGGNGNDVLYVVSGEDSYYYLYGDAGSDTIYTGTDLTGYMEVFSGADNDVVYGQGNEVYAVLGDGDDTYYGSVGEQGWSDIYLGMGNDTAIMQGAEGWIEGGEGDDIMTTSGANSAYWLLGEEGNDTLEGSTSGNDSLEGGEGNDLYIVHSATSITENAGQGIDTIQSSITYTITANVETLSLIGSSNINAHGSLGSESLIGNTGNNSLTGYGGNDTLIGGAGNDTLMGDGVLNGGNLVLNGDIEGDGVASGSALTTWAPDGWEDYGTAQMRVLGADFLGAGFNPTGDFVDLAAGGNTGMVQELSTVLGQSYTLSFSYRIDATNAASNQLLVRWGGATIATIDGSLQPDSWQTFTTTIVDNGNVELEFAEVGTNDAVGFFLDNITVTPNSGVAGNDSLSGGSGNDTYVFAGIGDGVDIVNDNGLAGDVDTLRIGAGGGLTRGNIALFQNGNDLEIAYVGATTATNKITVTNHFAGGNASRVENITFTGDNFYLTDAAIGTIITNMANYAASNSIALTDIDVVKNNANLMAIVNAGWTS